MWIQSVENIADERIIYKEKTEADGSLMSHPFLFNRKLFWISC